MKFWILDPEPQRSTLEQPQGRARVSREVVTEVPGTETNIEAMTANRAKKVGFKNSRLMSTQNEITGLAHELPN